MFSPNSGRAERVPSIRSSSGNVGTGIGGNVDGELASMCAKSRSHSLTMSPRNVTTLATDLRMGRSQNYVSSSNNMRSQRSPNTAGRRYSVTECDTSRSDSLRSINSEQVIDLMEREQDAIVLKLMREIAQLKEENKQLKSGMSSSSGSLRRSSSVSSQKSSISSASGTMPSSTSNAATNVSRKSSLSNYKLDSPSREAFYDSEYKKSEENRKKAKRKPSHDISHAGMDQETTVYHKLKSVDEENTILRQENEILKKQLQQLRQKVSKDMKI